MHHMVSICVFECLLLLVLYLSVIWPYKCELILAVVVEKVLLFSVLYYLIMGRRIDRDAEVRQVL